MTKLLVLIFTLIFSNSVIAQSLSPDEELLQSLNRSEYNSLLISIAEQIEEIADTETDSLKAELLNHAELIREEATVGAPEVAAKKTGVLKSALGYAARTLGYLGKGTSIVTSSVFSYPTSFIQGLITGKAPLTVKVKVGNEVIDMPANDYVKKLKEKDPKAKIPYEIQRKLLNQRLLDLLFGVGIGYGEYRFFSTTPYWQPFYIITLSNLAITIPSSYICIKGIQSENLKVKNYCARIERIETRYKKTTDRTQSLGAKVNQWIRKPFRKKNLSTVDNETIYELPSNEIH